MPNKATRQRLFRAAVNQVETLFGAQRVRNGIENLLPVAPRQNTLMRKSMEQQVFRHNGGGSIRSQYFRRNRCDLPQQDLCCREHRVKVFEELHNPSWISFGKLVSDKPHGDDLALASAHGFGKLRRPGINIFATGDNARHRSMRGALEPFQGRLDSDRRKVNRPKFTSREVCRGKFEETAIPASDVNEGVGASVADQLPSRGEELLAMQRPTAQHIVKTINRRFICLPAQRLTQL